MSKQIITSPSNEYISFRSNPYGFPAVFLAGTIDNGDSEDWQQQLIDRIPDSTDVFIFNPRRKEWNAHWSEDPEHRGLIEQIQWELRHLDAADIIVVNFEPDSRSPITLLELGLILRNAQMPHIFVRCPKEFYRYTNVLVTAEYVEDARIQIFETLDELYTALEREIC